MQEIQDLQLGTIATLSKDDTLSFWTAFGPPREAHIEAESRSASELLESEFGLLRLKVPVAADVVTPCQ